MPFDVENYFPWHTVAPKFRLFAKLVLILSLVIAAVSTARLFAYTPSSPQVTSTIKTGVAFLCSDLSKDSPAGAQAIAGIALLKSELVQPDHPKILAAVAKIKEVIPDNNPRTANIDNIYTVGMSIIFLVTLDPIKYKPEIECLMQFLYNKQKKHGGWGYYNLETGDTSMTQYGVLSSWEAKQAGYNLPPEAMEGVADWLLRTQDPHGGFGYQGIVAPEASILLPQEGVRHSMTAAGGGCVYILTDLFQMEVVPKNKDNLPTVLKDVRKKDTKNPIVIQTRINAKQMRESQVRTNEWMRANFSIENCILDTHNNKVPFNYQYYYLYALERYMSFRDLVEQTSEKEPKWYNEGVDYIIAHKNDDGSWEDHCGKTADTAFAVLFLVRSTRKTIEKAKHLGAGLLIGGRGVPKENERLETQNGQIVVKPSLGAADDLLKMLDDSKEADYEKALEMMDQLPSQQVESMLTAHGEKLRKLTREQEPEARMAAVVALGKTRNLDNVPALIFALTDPDREVVIEARKALERIGRNPTGFGPQDDYNEEQRRIAVEKWKTWYLSLRPDADVDF
jgi:hypothetical protein